MSSDFAIEVESVSKHYLIYRRPEDRLKQMVIPKVRRMLNLAPGTFYTDFAAVENVSLRIGRGETVGIIGRNGSGKSTLLQMICGTLQPTHGSVKVNGRIAALLELGAGFNGDFTGRENVKLNCAILGLSQQETDARFAAIEEFADIGIFIDQPVKTYSSGMYVRLAFAVAINVDPEILIIDEALAVGDEAFQRKCFARIEQIRERGATVLFVSHGAQTIVQLCDRAILMDRGEILLDGQPGDVVRQYQRLVNAPSDLALAIRKSLKDGNSPPANDLTDPIPAMDVPDALSATTRPAYFDPNLIVSNPFRYDSDGAEISGLGLETDREGTVNVVRTGGQYRIRYTVDFNRHAHQVVFGFQVKSVTGLIVAGHNTSMPLAARLDTVHPGDRVNVSIEFLCNLQAGTYFIDVGVYSFDQDARFLHRLVDASMFRVESDALISPIGHAFLEPRFEIAAQVNPARADTSQTIRMKRA